MTLSIPEITAEDARHLTDRIKIAVEGTWQLITEAYTTRAYLALGYRNWDDYCTREFGTARLRLPREERSEVVASLRESGLSIPAIVSATGYGYGTVQRELSAGYPNGQPDQMVEIPPPDDEPVLSQDDCEALDDTEWCDCGDGLCECLAGECSCSIVPELPEDLPVPEKRITGTDGKSYPVPKPPADPKPNRKPLPDSFWRATFDLGKEVARIEKLASDDRFNRNADQIKQSNLPDLIRARDALQRVIDKLNPQGV